MIANRKKFTKIAAVISLLALGTMPVLAEEQQEMEEIVVKGSLGSLPGENVESVFGFNKSILNTPRSVSTISSEIMERFNMQDIDELIVLAPGTFTQSFFGVAGGLDVRGTPGETYFRGVRRLDNPGNYPTPLGASDRIDIVRGPASPIYGPSKIGGYLNFNPKSSRVESTGQFIDEPEGSLSYTTGKWNKSILTAEVGGPTKIGGQDLGYYFYAELENSGSFYDNTDTDQTLIQASFDMDISDNLRIQFGGMYHNYDGNQIAGWNRLTQDLIDNSTYITGSAQPLDTNGDGSISHQEYNAVGLFLFRFDFLGDDPALTPGNPESLSDLQVLVGDTSALRLNNVGTAQLDESNVLVAPDDQLANEVTTLYFDVIYTADSGWEFKNQLFYEGYDNINENAYGFSQFHDSWVVEDKLIISNVFENDTLTTSVQISPSIRYTDFLHGDDFTNEFFNRRDLTGPSTALDRRLLATRIGRDFDNYDVGNYLDLGIAALVDFTWESGFSALLGARYDWIDIESKSRGDLLLFSAPIVKAQDDVGGTSWTVSLSYEMADGMFIPYATASEQGTLIAGQGAEIGVETIQSGGAFDTSDLQEIGIKGSLLDNKLYYAISAYKQERTDFSAQSIVTNQATETKGLEVELRWVVNENLLMTFGYSNIEVLNLNTLDSGSRFSFIGADDLPNVDPSELFGGTLGGFVSAGPSGGRRAGMPEDIFSVTATYDFNNGLTLSGSIVDVDSVASGFSNSVTLPAYTLVNLGLNYQTENWVFSVNGKNLTDERYFRANFPNLFGSQIVLPELPRHFQARVQYRF